MSALLWGKVFYKEHFAGFLKEEPGNTCTFSYDPSYLEAQHPAIAHTLPLKKEAFLSQNGLHPFFDNLVAEGWLFDAQTRLLGKRLASRFELLLAFGQDCAGAVSVIDPEAQPISAVLMDKHDPKEMGVLLGRSSLSGVQPKLTLIERDGKLYPTRIGELSSHIAKFPSATHSDLVFNEYLSTLAFKALLPDDIVVDLSIGEIQGFSEPALIIKRFDRTLDHQRIHFEEFNQLLAYPSTAKYEGSHQAMADFMWNNRCLPTEIYRLYLRILAGFLIGNTDMHLKNFALFHTPQGLGLTPVYDQVAASLYGYKTVALAIGGAKNLIIDRLKARTLIKLGTEFRLTKASIHMAALHLEKHLEAAKQAISESTVAKAALKKQIINLMEKRWNGTFALIGKP